VREVKSDQYRLLRVSRVVGESGGAREIVFVEPSRSEHAVRVSGFEAFDLALRLLPKRHVQYVREMLYRDRVDDLIDPKE
jgi:hypothetical protein